MKLSLEEARRLLVALAEQEALIANLQKRLDSYGVQVNPTLDGIDLHGPARSMERLQGMLKSPEASS